MNKDISTNGASNAPAWISVLISAIALWYAYASGSNMDTKVEEALKTAQKVLEEQEHIRKGDPLFLENSSAVLRDWISNSSQKVERPDGLLRIRNLGGDTITEIWVAWKPMLRPIPKEAPNVDERKVIANQVALLKTGHSDLSKRILAPGESTSVMNLPDIFSICFNHPNVPFYGSVKLVPDI